MILVHLVHGNHSNLIQNGFGPLQERQEAQKLLEDILGVATWQGSASPLSSLFVVFLPNSSSFVWFFKTPLWSRQSRTSNFITTYYIINKKSDMFLRFVKYLVKHNINMYIIECYRIYIYIRYTFKAFRYIMSYYVKIYDIYIYISYILY